MSTEDRPMWDERRARGLVGKIVLLGLTFSDSDGQVIERAQRYGMVEAADAESGFAIRLISEGHPWDGELYRLPPDLRPFAEAEPGTYRLRSTGEEVIDPDFTATWEIRDPSAEDDTPARRQARLAEARRFGFSSS
jgi:hypothetical protein